VIRWAILGAAIALASACSSAPVRIDSRALGNQPADSSDRFIIVAVENAPAAYVAHAGATPRGYDTVRGLWRHCRSAQSHARIGAGVRTARGQRLADRTAAYPLRRSADSVGRRSQHSLLARLSKDRRVRLTQPLQTFATRTGGYNDPYVGLQRGFQQMDVADAHPWSRGEGVKVAINRHRGRHSASRFARQHCPRQSTSWMPMTRNFSANRHGTEMAGVIAAVANNREGIVGVAPNARLLIFKACWQAQSDADAARCNSFTLARALTAAFAAHAQIINLSLAGPDDPLLVDLIREGQHRGVLFVGAAAADPSGQPGLMHQAGVIEVASADGRLAGDTVLYAPDARSSRCCPADIMTSPQAPPLRRHR